MGVPEVDENQLSQIGDYVKNHMVQWMNENNIYPFPQNDRSRDTELLERMVTVEQQIKHQNEKFDLMMQFMEKRFEGLDKRFEDMNHRFNSQTWLISIGFTVITVLMSLYRFLG